MTDQHPITPPLELVQQWRKSAPADAAVNNAYEHHIATQAARWGADQELEACCSWVSQFDYDDYSYGDRLRAARRGRTTPPSLKEQALKELAWVDENLNMPLLNQCDAIQTIRRALESLPQ